jgi:hypothetical protein
MLLVVPVVIACVGACSSRPPSPARTVTQTVTISAPPPTTTVATTTPPPSAEGQEVRDGNLAFTVGGALLEPGSVGVAMSVRNIGDHSATFYVGYQKLIDVQGREFSASENGKCIVGKGSSGMIMFDLNPGIEADCMLNFDAPGNIAITGGTP